ncbi:MAG: hypothetical protein V3U83_06155 [Acidobacteriota bacterium]
MIRKHAIIILLLATLGGSAAPQPARPALLPGGPAPDLNLVFTSQVIGWIEPCG